MHDEQSIAETARPQINNFFIIILQFIVQHCKGTAKNLVHKHFDVDKIKVQTADSQGILRNISGQATQNYSSGYLSRSSIHIRPL